MRENKREGRRARSPSTVLPQLVLIARSSRPTAVQVLILGGKRERETIAGPPRPTNVSYDRAQQGLSETPIKLAWRGQGMKEGAGGGVGKDRIGMADGRHERGAGGIVGGAWRGLVVRQLVNRAAMGLAGQASSG